MIRLTELKIKKISKYDKNKQDNILTAIYNDIDEVENIDEPKFVGQELPENISACLTSTKTGATF